MAWQKTGPMDEKLRFVVAAKEKRLSMVELCRVFGVAPKTGYKWLERFGREGLDGLKERSRRPLSNGRAASQEVADRLLDARRRHPTWGARKLLAWLEARSRNKLEWPAASTVTALFKRHHLVSPRSRSQPRPRRGSPLAVASAPNDVWAGDFKGYFLVGDGKRCDPLTVTDGYSRSLLCCKGLPSQRGEAVQTALTETFREYGLPAVFRTDNGAPFGAPSYGLISNLAVWLIRLGVLPEYIDPGRPQQNGRHERMHLTLKQDTALPPAADLHSQQRRFDAFRGLYNGERPHEALGQNPPSSVYAPSARRFPRRLPELAYPRHYHLRQVKHCGDIKWLGHLLRLTSSLRGQTVGLEEVADGCWEIHFGPLRLGRFHKAMPHLGLVRDLTKPLPMSPV
jgi:putative transposase